MFLNKNISNNSNILSNDKLTYLIVGVGNVGNQYDNTRHNAGFMAVDNFAMRHRVSWKNTKFSSHVAHINLDGNNVILAKPTTLMNLSGEAVQKLQKFYKIPLERILIIYDDIDIQIGRARMKEHGSAGTHNGMKSIIKHLSSQGFPRLRIGIGPKPFYIDMIDFVLGKFSASERKLLDETIEASNEAVELFVKGDFQKAMTKLNTGS